MIGSLPLALNIKVPETDRLARDLAAVTGETITEGVANALRERLAREQSRPRGRDLVSELREIVARVAALPVLDDRSPDELMGWDEHGLPT